MGKNDEELDNNEKRLLPKRQQPKYQFYPQIIR